MDLSSSSRRRVFFALSTAVGWVRNAARRAERTHRAKTISIATTNFEAETIREAVTAYNAETHLNAGWIVNRAEETSRNSNFLDDPPHIGLKGCEMVQTIAIPKPRKFIGRRGESLEFRGLNMIEIG